MLPALQLGNSLVAFCIQAHQASQVATALQDGDTCAGRAPVVPAQLAGAVLADGLIQRPARHELCRAAQRSARQPSVLALTEHWRQQPRCASAGNAAAPPGVRRASRSRLPVLRQCCVDCSEFQCLRAQCPHRCKRLIMTRAERSMDTPLATMRALPSAPQSHAPWAHPSPQHSAARP